MFSLIRAYLLTMKFHFFSVTFNVSCLKAIVEIKSVYQTQGITAFVSKDSQKSDSRFSHTKMKTSKPKQNKIDLQHAWMTLDPNVIEVESAFKQLTLNV